MSATFRVNGIFAGIKKRRTTPGGIILRDFSVSVKSNKIPWKQEKNSNLHLTAWGELASKLDTFKSGQKIEIEGVIESYNDSQTLMVLDLKNGG